MYLRIILFVIFSSFFLNCSYFANADQNHNNEVVLVEDDVSSSDEDTANKKPWSAEFKLDMEGNGQTGEIFVPTKEWQIIKPGQIIPKGIHVRLNIQTGEREGKLLDQEENNTNDKIVEVKHSDASNDRNRVFSKELEDALKKLNDEKQAKSEEEKSADQANEDEKIRNKYKSYEKIKEEMEELNLNVKTDYEIMKDLILKLNSSDKLDRTEKMAVLKDLEFYVHQYDNGLLLCDMGGFNNILADLNKTEDVQMSIESILVLGAAIQSHPKVKIYAIKTDLLQYILNKLSLQAESDSALEKDFNSRLIFALSGLLRNFPFAQSQFIRYGGVEIFSKLVKHSNSIKLKTKILTLIDDLIKEKNEIVENKGSVIIDNYQEKLEQYEKINLMDELMEKKWCEAYEILLNDAEDYDTREKIINSIMTLIDKCRENFRSNRNLLNNLKKFKKDFTKTVENDDDNYLLNLIQSIDYILLKIDTKDEF